MKPIFMNEGAKAGIISTLLLRGVYRLQLALLKAGIVLTRDVTLLDRPRDLATAFTYDSFDYVRFSTLELLTHEIRERNIPGACAELGVFQGCFAREINRWLPDRPLYLFDTFAGFDAAQLTRDIEDGNARVSQDFSGVSVESVLSRMPHPEQCRPRPGFFPETTVGLEEERFVLVSLDVDLYEPTYAGLLFFYDRLSPGGIILIHDYNNYLYAGVKKAVNDFMTGKHSIMLPLSDHFGSLIVMRPPQE